MNRFDGDVVEIDAVETTHVDGPEMGRRSWPPKRKDAAFGTEVVGGLMGVKSVGREVLKRGEQIQGPFRPHGGSGRLAADRWNNRRIERGRAPPGL